MPRALLLRVAAAVVTAALVAACAKAPGPRGIAVVASFYPLAWVAGQTGGRLVKVGDLTPPGVEPHDLSLSADQRAEIERAALVLLIGHGFQPQVEAAAKEARGRVIDVLAGLGLRRSSERGLGADPHVWLDPTLMAGAGRAAAAALSGIDPANRASYEAASDRTARSLQALDGRLRAALSRCRYTTMIVTHEAFGYLAARYGLEQFGLTGLTPESEPSAEAIRSAGGLVRSGKAAAVFYEESDSGRRMGESAARDLGVKAIPLRTLETDPAPKDYLSAMEANGAALSTGLACAS